MKIWKINPCAGGWLLLCVVMLATVALDGREADLDLHEVLRRHQRALGDVALSRGLNSLETRGSGMQQGRAFTYSLHKKAPHFLRYEIRYDGYEEVLVFDGMHAWKWRHRPEPGGLTRVQAEAASWVRQEAVFGSILSEDNRRGYDTGFPGLNILDGSLLPVYHVRLTARAGEGRIDVYLNADSFLEVRRVYRPAADAEPLVIDYSDYRNVSGFMIPHRIIGKVGGTEVSNVRVEEVRLNRGMLNFYFRPPPGLQLDND